MDPQQRGRDRSNSKLRGVSHQGTMTWIRDHDAKYLEGNTVKDQVFLEVARRGSISIPNDEEEDIATQPLPNLDAILDLPPPILANSIFDSEIQFKFKFFPELPLDEMQERLETEMEDAKDQEIELAYKLKKLQNRGQQLDPRWQEELLTVQKKIFELTTELEQLKKRRTSSADLPLPEESMPEIPQGIELSLNEILPMTPLEDLPPPPNVPQLSDSVSPHLASSSVSPLLRRSLSRGAVQITPEVSPTATMRTSSYSEPEGSSFLQDDDFMQDESFLQLGVENKLGVVVSGASFPDPTWSEDWVTFARNTFLKNPKTSFRDPVESWSARPLPDKSLFTTLSSDKKAIADSIYWKIKAFAGEKKTKETETEIISSIIRQGIDSKSMRDEIFAQLLKHTWKNQNLLSRVKGWQLMTYCVSMFLPHDEDLLHVLWTRADSTSRDQSQDLTTRQELAFLLSRFKRTLKNGNRLYPPSNDELTAIEKKTAMRFKVTIFQAQSKNLLIDSSSSVEEVISVLIKKLHLARYDGFSLYETSGFVFRKLASSLACADLLARAESLKLIDSKYQMNIQLRKSTWSCFQNTWPDSKQREVLFRQICSDIGCGRYPIPIHALLSLAGLALSSTLEKPMSNTEDYAPMVNNYISPHWVAALPVKSWTELLAFYHKKYSHLAKDQCQVEYLTMAQETPLFGANIFPNLYAKASNVKQMNPQFDLAITRVGMFFLDENWKVVYKIEWENLKNASSHDASELLLVQTFSGDTVEIGCFQYLEPICEELSLQVETFRKFTRRARTVATVVSKEDLLEFPEGAMIDIIDPPEPDWPLWFSARYGERFGMVSVHSVQFQTEDRWKCQIPTQPLQDKPPVSLDAFKPTQLLAVPRQLPPFQVPDKWSSAVTHQQFTALSPFVATSPSPSLQQFSGLSPSVIAAFSTSSSNASPSGSFNILKSSKTFKAQLSRELGSSDSYDNLGTAVEKKELSPQETKVRAMKELTTTEREFLQDLKLTHEFFQKPMLATPTKFLPSEEAVKKIFSNLHDLIVFSKKFGVQLEEACKDETGEAVGTLFIDSFEDMKQCFGTYCTGHSVFVGDTHEKLKQNPYFLQWEDEQRNKVPDIRRRLQLSDFLIKPVQRVTKYSLMLETIQKCTAEDTPARKTLASGITCINGLVLFINERAKEIDNENKMSRLVSAMEGSDVINQILGKILIIQLSCKSSSKQASPDLRAVLFDDHFLLLKVKTKDKLTPVLNIEFGNLMLVDLADDSQTKETNRIEIRDKTLFLKGQTAKVGTIVCALSGMEKKKLWEAFLMTQKNYYTKKHLKQEDPTVAKNTVTRSRNQVGSNKILEKESLMEARTLSTKNIHDRFANASSHESLRNTALRSSGLSNEQLGVQARITKSSSPVAASPASSPTINRDTVRKTINLSKNTLKMEGVHSADDLFSALQWTPKPIKSPILNLSAHLQTRSRHTFKCIMTYMGDLPTKNKAAQNKALQEFIEVGLNTQELWDEMLLQIVQQLKNNPHRENEIRGWHILYSALTSFIPQTNQVVKILSDLFDAYQNVELSPIVRLTSQLFEIQMLKPLFRRRVPSELELAWMQGATTNIKLTVEFMDGTIKSFFITSLDTAEVLRDQIWTKLGASTPKYEWGLFEKHQQTGILRAVADNELLCDYLSFWEEQANKKKPEEYCFVYKRRFISNELKDEYDLITSNQVLFNLIFTQLLDEIIKGYLPITLTQSYTLIPCFLLAKYGPRKNSDIDRKKLQKFCPPHIPKTNPTCKLPNWAKAIEDEWSRIKHTQDGAKKRVLEYLKDNHFLGSHIVPVTKSSKTRWLVLSKAGLSVCEPQKQTTEKIIKYHDIINVFGSRDSLKIEYGNMTSPDSISFSGPLGGFDALLSLFRTLYF